MSQLSGKVWCFGDNIDTDLIIAARYLNTSDPKELAKHVMEDADPEFVKKVGMGDIIGGTPERRPVIDPLDVIDHQHARAEPVRPDRIGQLHEDAHAGEVFRIVPEELHPAEAAELRVVEPERQQPVSISRLGGRMAPGSISWWWHRHGC